MTKRPCHFCGSTNWPSDTTTCPLCFGDPDPEPDYDEDDCDHFRGVTEMAADADHCGEVTDMVADAIYAEEIKHE